jgi:outer membrane protein OmpA-like peptidoglycan-associated protein
MPTNKKVTDESDALEEALAPIVNKLIDKNFENSQEKLAIQIAPLIGVAIKEQIRTQKDDIVDALYPVMGNMISKFVTKSLEEMLHKINAQIQNGLSSKAIKRKIKAKIKGVSETELLLQEHSSAQIQSVLLIHKESGTLLTKVERNSDQLSDPDMLASMMTAIRSFVNDWITKDNNYQELGEIEYGGNKIIIEASGSSYLAIIVEGAAYTKTYEAIADIFSKLVTQYGEAIQAFDGNTNKLPLEDITALLETLLLEETQLQEEKKKVHPLLILLPLLLIGWFAFNSYKNYLDAQLEEKVLTKLEQIPQLTLYKIQTQVKDKELTIKGNVPYAYYKNLTQTSLQKIDGIEKIHNNISVVPILTDPMQVSMQIAYYIKGLQTNKNIHISYNFDFSTLQLKGSVPSEEIKQKILQDLQKIDGLENIKEQIQIVPLQINTVIYFSKGSSKLSINAQTKLIKILKELQENSDKSTLLLKAYSDKIGSQKSNRLFAQKRLTQIKKFLQEQGQLKNKIKSEIFDSSYPGLQKDSTKESRCVHISLEQKSS